MLFEELRYVFFLCWALVSFILVCLVGFLFGLCITLCVTGRAIDGSVRVVLSSVLYCCFSCVICLCGYMVCCTVE